MNQVLLDSLKRKTYDDVLRREELLNYIRRLQTSSQKVRFDVPFFTLENVGGFKETIMTR